MVIIKICLYFLTLFSCIETSKDDIVVIGNAENAKAGAIVIAKDDKKIYYIEGLSYWDNKTVGKLVKVSGKLLIEKTEPRKEGEEIKQQIVGVKRTIQKPKWELVK